MRILVVATVLAIVVGCVRCQEDGEEGNSLFSRFKAAVKSFFESIRSMWGELKEEVKARTRDMKDWSQEMWTSFKGKMFEWIDERGDASAQEKEDMRKYIERMRMEEQEA
ncbi:hypothetical protein CDAR_294341 [Caerostris darwini]|uniref:Uncharacterized protein n=1 Tax=Caerostris darwini TaxID=1538125 RepID=A0AAV4SYP4_9ARAC|nr:hypothetical protein CDAR_294341 [Caerostris darwini]